MVPKYLQTRLFWNRLLHPSAIEPMKSQINRFFIICVLVLSCAFSALSQNLYVGANYHPHDDRNVEKIKKDIALMKEAGFTLVRLGHLAWDSYEPQEGQFEFAWFDEVMDLLGEAGIQVILDIAIRPAPLWLHHKFPSINITDASGAALYPNHRYMEDVGDPNYQKYAIRYTDELTKHYANHPALLAFGIDNESGDGPISYSESVRLRFITWLKAKYKTTEKLDQAWAGQRWSRKINEWEEVGLPMSGSITGAPERILDFRRFISDEVNQILFKVLEVVETNAPNALTNTNAWFYSHLKYFDYSEIAYSGKMTRQGCGFYPGPSLTTNYGVMNSAFGISRIQYESETPFWANEFTTMTAVPNSIRKSAYATLMYGNQMVCGWTWQSMWAGEEQYLEGMVDWDGIPNRQYHEYQQIASEFSKIAPYFPYQLKAEVGLAFSFPSQIASAAFPERHDSQLQACWDLFYWRNMDARVVEISKSKLPYKLLFVPGVAVMDATSAQKIRDFVSEGGTVVMTSNSAFVDATGQIFKTTRPGMLSDVFGIRLGSYEETEVLNEISRKGYKGKNIELTYKGKTSQAEAARFDLIDLKGATVLGNVTSMDKDYPIITSNKFGKGTAIYVGLPAKGEVLDGLLDDLIKELGIKKGPAVPSGVMARQIDENHFLYLNVSGEPKEIPIKGKSKSLLFDKEFNGNILLAPFEPEFIEIK